MSSLTKYIVLNAGKKTRSDFMAGAGGMPVFYYKSKETILHISATGDISFINHNTPIDFENAYVFTRLRASDQQFCGILYEYLTFRNIPRSDPVNLVYPGGEEKITQMLLLALHNIKIPESIIFREESFAANRDYIHSHLSFPAIYKTDGSQGRNVHLIESVEDLEKYIARKKAHVLAMLQPFIDNEYDTRTLVAFGQVLGSIKRERQNGFLNNVSQGALVSRYELTKEEARTAQLATKIARLDFAGVDMFHTASGPMVIEVNKSPQVGGFESVHDFRVFTRLAEMIRTAR